MDIVLNSSKDVRLALLKICWFGLVWDHMKLLSQLFLFNVLPSSLRYIRRAMQCLCVRVLKYQIEALSWMFCRNAPLSSGWYGLLLTIFSQRRFNNYATLVVEFWPQIALYKYLLVETGFGLPLLTERNGISFRILPLLPCEPNRSDFAPYISSLHWFRISKTKLHI